MGVASTLGVGSTFYAIAAARREGRRSRDPSRAAARTGARTILIVEDDDRDREAVATTLAQVGYGFEIARTGADAIARCKERAFDAVTLDLLLPDMSGLDVLESLRIGGYLRDTPVIVVTIVPDMRHTAGFSVSGILQKPLDRDALLGHWSGQVYGPSLGVAYE